MLSLVFSTMANAEEQAAKTEQDRSDFGGFFGQLSTAEAIPPGAIDIGAYIGFYEDANALFGRFCVGLFTDADLDIKSGVLDTEGGDDPDFMIGSSFKYHFYHKYESAAPDMAFSTMLEYYDAGKDASVWLIGFGLIGSYPIELMNDSYLTPYGRVNTRIERVSAGSYKDTDFDIGLNVGAQYALSERVQFYTELQIDDQIGFIGGINFAIY